MRSLQAGASGTEHRVDTTTEHIQSLTSRKRTAPSPGSENVSKRVRVRHRSEGSESSNDGESGLVTGEGEEEECSSGAVAVNEQLCIVQESHGIPGKYHYRN